MTMSLTGQINGMIQSYYSNALGTQGHIAPDAYNVVKGNKYTINIVSTLFHLAMVVN